jgi:hypothetical protein
MTKKNTGWPSAEANSAIPAKPKAELASLAGLAVSDVLAERDTKGRFISGNNGGGRKKGSRNRLTDTFIAAIENDFAQYGADALTKLREDDPAAYIKVVAGLVPRDLIMKREQELDLTQLNLEEMGDLLERTRQNAMLHRWLYQAKQGQ